MPWQLVLEDKEHRGSHLLEGGRTVVGADAGCDVQVSDLTVSRRHAVLAVDGDELTLEDLGSRNGTRLAGERIERAVRLSDGDELTFGSVAAKVHEVTAKDARPAVRFDPAPSGVQPSPAPAVTTLASGSLHQLLTEGLPGLLRDLADGSDLKTMAARVGRVALDTLPARKVTIGHSDRGGTGVLFVGEGGAASEDDRPANPVEAVRGDLVVEVAFALPSQARGYRPLVEAFADVLRAARRGTPAPRPLAAAEVPSLPSPPTLDPRLRQIYEEAAQVARGDVSVLIRGESGTGKEVLARYLHAASQRREESYVALNCAALPRDLLESELFGVESGVATGVRARPGKFELADGGTLFLDEIGDMAADTQARILRVLQEGEVYRLGGTEPRAARVRILAATNRDLEALRREGAFRDDLYHRIADWVVELPPLRERRRDVANLAAYFLLRECERRGVRAAGVSEAAVEALRNHPWPGNVRQLEREIGRAALFLETGEMLQLRHLQPEIREPAAGAPADGAGQTLQQAVEEAERIAIRRAVRGVDGNMVAAARALGIGRTTLYRRVKELGIEL